MKANDIRPGNVIKYENKYCIVTKTMHTQPGKGGAYIQVEMKDMIYKNKIHARFRSSESIERIRMEQKTVQYLYDDGNNIVSMDLETYDHIEFPKELLGNKASLLKDGMKIFLELHEKKIVLANLPDTIEVSIEECEVSIKNQTATSSYKSAKIEGGLRVMVPVFINNGDKIIIDSSTLEYLERVK